jgi:hypothetical protein
MAAAHAALTPDEIAFSLPRGCMTTSSLSRLIDVLMQDASLDEPGQLPRRIDAMELLERELFHAGDEVPASLHRQGAALLAKFEAVNHTLYRSIRDDIRDGSGAASLQAWASAMRKPADHDSYDALDTLLGGVLDFEEPHDVAELAADMVFYQPTPARHIFDFIARAKIEDRDVVMDLGSGLGHVAILTAMCTNARCIGIEVEPAYVRSARTCARSLGVSNACFLAQDVRHADLSEGTVFYLYTPFTGSILRTVLDMLRREAEHRAIRLCTLGPCTAVVANEQWLRGVRQDVACPALWRSL